MYIMIYHSFRQRCTLNLSFGSDGVAQLTFAHVCYFKNFNPISSQKDMYWWINNACVVVTDCVAVFKSVK